MNRKRWVRDFYLDAKVLLYGLGDSSRYELALNAVQEILTKEENSPKDILLVGHSLGAAIALQTGRAMAKKGTNIETYLFNPPHPSTPFEKLLKNQDHKNRARMVRSLIIAGLWFPLQMKKHLQSHENDHDEDSDPFAKLGSWIPWIFLNPKDYICCEYVGYFEHREKMKSWGIGEIVAKNSVMSLALRYLGYDIEASHLIPLAYVIVNMKNMIVQEDGSLLSHDLSQWWEQHSYWQSKVYQFS